MTYHISTSDLLSRLGIHSIDHYYYSQCISWGGHLARMSLQRIPRMFLTSWIADTPRSEGHPFTNWTNSFENALKAKNISTGFTERTTLAQDRV